VGEAATWAAVGLAGAEVAELSVAAVCVAVAWVAHPTKPIAAPLAATVLRNSRRFIDIAQILLIG
jgi:hypothetical protein